MVHLRDYRTHTDSIPIKIIGARAYDFSGRTGVIMPTFGLRAALAVSVLLAAMQRVSCSSAVAPRSRGVVAGASH